MRDHLSENYLDRLLNSVNGDETEELDGGVQPPQTEEESLERELFGEPDTVEMVNARNEEDFLREFEAELLKEDIPDYMENFEQDLSAFSPQEPQSEKDDIGLTIDEMIERMPQQVEEDFPAEELIPEVDENADFNGTLPEEPKESGGEIQADSKEEESVPVQPQEESGKAASDDGELDLSGLGDQDLMDMLSGDENLSDLGDMLTIDAEGRPIEAGDSIGEFAEAQMAAQEQEMQQEDDAEGGKKKKKKRGSLFARLSKFFFGADEEEQTAAAIGTSDVDAVTLSEENQQILKELEEAAMEEEPESGKKKKKKDKKEKKEAKQKKAKEPKAKKPKEKKPKKEKKPREKDTTPPLPRGPVIAIIVMVASLFGLVMLVTNLLGYQVNMSDAQAAYDQGDYVTAFQNLQGLDIKENDETYYNKLATLAAVSEKYQAYLVFDNNGSADIALDSLVCAYGRYDVNKEYAKEYECEKELEAMGGKILKALLKEYDMTGEEALEIYRIKDRDEYTLELRKKLNELEMEVK